MALNRLNRQDHPARVTIAVPIHSDVAHQPPVTDEAHNEALGLLLDLIGPEGAATVPDLPHKHALVEGDDAEARGLPTQHGAVAYVVMHGTVR